MEFVDLKAQYNTYKTEIDTAIAGVIDTTAFINGSSIQSLENNLQKYTEAKYTLTCSSGTDALLIPLMAYDIQPGDEIIVPAFTYFASASMISHWKAKPVFVDVESETFNIDPQKIEEKITSKTKGIFAVSLYGQMPDIASLKKIAREYGLWILEDGAQSFGATQNGNKSCAWADVSTTSFFPAKPLGCYGDGGAIFTDSDELAEKMLMIRNHGQEARYKHKYIGINGRMDTIQAAIVDVKLKHFDDELKKRDCIALEYSEQLLGTVQIPKIKPQNTSSWAQYTIKVDKRDELREYLKECGIPTSVHYPMPVPKQVAFQYLSITEQFPVAEKLSSTVLSLPMHPFLTDEEITFVCNKIKGFYNG